jgi:hypothetical protein
LSRIIRHGRLLGLLRLLCHRYCLGSLSLGLLIGVEERGEGAPGTRLGTGHIQLAQVDAFIALLAPATALAANESTATAATTATASATAAAAAATTAARPPETIAARLGCAHIRLGRAFAPSPTGTPLTTLAPFTAFTAASGTTALAATAAAAGTGTGGMGHVLE